ncbi:hypothetical protein [Vulcaniibacterium gelatinicum]|uniref:hypothetical protein n=1 Tax=Vulcaniibacterium gelatinicum TaxID=2598725 RepID=UPI0011CB5616|nr:hypothetical protein [Vulcaniibacterium gelatinicum]
MIENGENAGKSGIGRLGWLLIALAGLRAHAYFRHQRLADLLAVLGFVLLAFAMSRDDDTGGGGQKDRIGLVAAVLGAGSLAAAAIMMLVANP